MHNNLHKNIISSRIFILFLFTFSFLQGNTQVREWFKIYADEQGSPARYDHLSFNINYNNWVHNIKGLKTQPYSLGFDLTIYKDIPLSKSGKVSFAYALNYSFNSIHHNGDISYITDTVTSNLYTTISESNSSFVRNKLTTHYLEIPLELRFRKISKPKIRFYMGFKAGVLMGIHTTRVTKETKYKQYRLKNSLPYRYGPTLKVGVGKINIYGFYSMTPLFEEGKGDALNQFSIGLSFFAL
jgi:hypothetical protein